MTARALPLSFGLCLFLPWAIPASVFGADLPSPPATQPPRLNIADRATSSSLVRCKQSTDDALRAVSALGFKWVDVAEYIEGFNEPDAERESRRFLDWAKQL
jgi:hypothetical protein